MWHSISDRISQSIGADFICDDIREVNGGDSHQAFRISDGRRRFFIKLNDEHKHPCFESEADGLTQFAKARSFRVPKVIALGVVEGRAFLALEHINMVDGEPDQWFDFGQQLAQCHQNQTGDNYGWHSDNFIGPTPQVNGWNANWNAFFAVQRIGFLLERLADCGHKLADIDSTVASVQEVLGSRKPTASLLHGDLWLGNTGFSKGRAVIFDPALYYGDRETDLAMSELFQQFPDAFYRGYQRQWPLDPGYDQRKGVYQLYHLLNHALIFGGHYLDSAKHQLATLDT